MKKVYIPTTDDLIQLKSNGINTYPYLLAKTVEAIVMEDIVYAEEDMFEVAYEELHEFPEILYAIAKMYPERIQYSESASKDINLCIQLTTSLFGQDKSIYHLDKLVYFNQGTNNLDETSPLLNSTVVSNVSRILADKLLTNPRYRFEYQEPNILLDSIFACELPSSSIEQQLISNLIAIDPTYAIKLHGFTTNSKGKLTEEVLFNLKRSLIQLSNRYGFSKNLSNPSNGEKKLLRCLENHRKNFL